MHCAIWYHLYNLKDVKNSHGGVLVLLDPNDNITQSESFKSKTKITGKAPAAGNTKNVEIIVPLKYLSNFWRTLKMSFRS